ncbi:MAG TPA: hypothetical protein VIK19_07880, partial [Syntrophales bacterium]
MAQRTIILPQVCYVCGMAADHDEHVTIVANYKSTRLNVPICLDCARRKKRAGRGLAVILSIFAFMFLISIGFAAELGRQARLAGASTSTKVIAIAVQVLSLLALVIIIGSISGFVRDGIRAFALRLTGSFKTWREAWTW